MAIPEILGLDGDSLGYRRGDGAVLLDQAPLSNSNDGDFLAFGGGSLVVSVVSGGAGDEDRLSIRSTGTGANEIAVAGNRILFEGIAFGSFTGGASGDDLVVSFLSQASETAVTALVRSITYENAQALSPTPGTRQIAFEATDNTGNVSNTATVSVAVQAPPVISHLDGDFFRAPVTGLQVSLDQGVQAVVSDADSLDFDGGNLRIDKVNSLLGDFFFAAGVTAGGDGDIQNGEAVAVGGTVIGTVASNGDDATDLLIDFNPDATVGLVETLVRAIQFAADLNGGVTDLSVTLTDGDGNMSDPAIVKVATHPDAVPDASVAFRYGVTNVVTYDSIGEVAAFAGSNYLIFVDGDSYSAGPETLVFTGSDVRLALPAPHAATVILGHQSYQPKAFTVYGDAQVDVIGNDIANDIFGGGGDNEISGLAGNDSLFGFAGDDLLMGQGDNDLLDGGLGNDTLIGDQGDDTLLGGPGDDLLVGGLGEDVLYGGTGNDILQGLEHDDTLFGEAGDDLLWGDQGDDLLIGNVGDDTLIGGADNDTLVGDEGNDTLLGGDGEDLLAGGSGNDRLEGGADTDILQGWTGDDDLFGDGGDDTLYGDAGDDTLAGGAGDDILTGGGGSDTFFFLDGDGNDTITDFSAGAGVGDRLNVAAFGFADFSAVLAATSDTGGGALVQLDGDDSVTLAGVLKADLVADDFILS